MFFGGLLLRRSSFNFHMVVEDGLVTLQGFLQLSHGRSSSQCVSLGAFFLPSRWVSAESTASFRG